MRSFALAVFLGLSACAAVPVDVQVPAPSQPQPQPQPQPSGGGLLADPSGAPRLDGRTAVRNFVAVVERVEPVAEQVCRTQAPQLNCDFAILVDDRPGAPANAFQTRDANGRPVIAFTVPLIAEARNQDELAFIMAHEAAHHIAGHLDRQRRNATLGAILIGGLAGAVSPDAQRTAQQIGASIGARTYSKDFELEADAMGTRIAQRAGFDPVRGAAFFARIPDPGNSFLGTHPANAQRIAVVQRVAAGG